MTSYRMFWRAAGRCGYESKHPRLPAKVLASVSETPPGMYTLRLASFRALEGRRPVSKSDVILPVHFVLKEPGLNVFPLALARRWGITVRPLNVRETIVPFSNAGPQPAQILAFRREDSGWTT